MNDPLFDFFIWLQSGAQLSAVTTVAALTGLTRYLGVPLIKQLALKIAKVALSGKQLLAVVYAFATLAVYVIAYATKQTVALTTLLGLSWVIANGAVGLHASGKTMTEVPDAQSGKP